MGVFNVLCPKFNVTSVSGATSNLKHRTLNSPLSPLLYTLIPFSDTLIPQFRTPIFFYFPSVPSTLTFVLNDVIIN